MEHARGAHEVGDGLWAYLQPDGGWGWSNAGLVTDGDASLLVDTLFDLVLTQQMLDELRAVSPAAATIGTVVNTHANGDHCYGNQLVADADIVASTASAREMDEVPPATLAGLMRAADGLGEAGAFLRDIFGSFTFDGIEAVPPTTTFDGELDLRVGDRPVRLLELGPAHTGGDVVVHVPDADVLYTGDLVFHGNHPMVWAGPVAHWIEACDRMLALGATTVVPGHGPSATARASTTSAATSSGSWPRAPRGSKAAWLRSTRPATWPVARTTAGASPSGWWSTSPRCPATSARSPPPTSSPSSAAWPTLAKESAG